MPRAIWSGSISFGLVNVPVKLYSAVHPQGLSFHQFQEGTNARVRNKRVSEKTGKEVAYEDIVKGYEVEKGQYVMVEPDELAEFDPRATRTIDIEDFVALDDIDPIYYDATYYLAPEDSDGARKAYALLLKAMEDQGKVAIGRLVMRNKQYLAAIRPLDGGAGRVDDAVPRRGVSPADIDGIPTGRSAPRAAARRGEDGRPDHRVDDAGLGPEALRGHVPCAGARLPEEEGRRRGDRGRGGARGAVQGRRPHGRPRGQPGGGQEGRLPAVLVLAARRGRSSSSAKKAPAKKAPAKKSSSTAGVPAVEASARAPDGARSRTSDKRT